MANHSRPIAALCNRLDYLGIVVLMWSAAVSAIYFWYPCGNSLRATHWALVCRQCAG